MTNAISAPPVVAPTCELCFQQDESCWLVHTNSVTGGCLIPESAGRYLCDRCWKRGWALWWPPRYSVVGSESTSSGSVGNADQPLCASAACNRLASYAWPRRTNGGLLYQYWWAQAYCCGQCASASFSLETCHGRYCEDLRAEDEADSNMQVEAEAAMTAEGEAEAVEVEAEVPVEQDQANGRASRALWV